MLRRIFLSTIMLPLIVSTVKAGTITNIDFLYFSEPIGNVQRNVLQLDIKKRGKCRILPIKSSGNRLEVVLDNCTISEPYILGRRGNFVKKVKLVPLGHSSKLIIYLSKKGVIKIVQYKNKISMKVEENEFVVPKINVERTVSGEVITVVVPKSHTLSFERKRRKLILKFDKVMLKPMYRRLNTDSVTYLRVLPGRNRSLMIFYLKPTVEALGVFPEKNKVVLRFKLVKVAKKTGNRLEQSGPKVALHFTNADVRSVVKAIANVAGINVVFDPEVSGKVNVDFKKPVYWKDALKAVLEPLMLTYIETPEYYRILPKSKIIKQEKVEPLKNFLVKLNYVNAKKVADNIKKLIKRGTVSVNTETNSLLLQVTQSDFKEIQKFLKSIDKPRKEVLVKAKIIQINSKAEKDLGFSWYISGFNFMGSKPASYLTGSYGFNTGSYTPLISPDSLANYSKIPVMDSTLALGILNKSQNLRVELALKALEIDGDAQVISSPKVLTLDNEEATIEQGIEIPYRESTVGAGGATSYNINFKKASLILKVKPHITDDGKILLDLEVRKDSPNYEYVAITGSGEPAINTRNVKSKVLLNDGDTVVIGGIYEKEKQKSTSAVPGLSRIPLLGWLFRNSKTTVSKSEMLVFITPVILNSGEKTAK